MKITKDEIMSRLQKARVVTPSAPKVVHHQGPRSQMYHPHRRMFTRGNNAVDPRKKVNYEILRRVSEKAWLINTIIAHISRQMRPFLKPTTDENVRGYRIRLKDRDRKPTKDERELMETYSQFFYNTGFGDDPDREDNLMQYGMKVIRDALIYDEITTEIQRRRNGKPWAFWALDAATIYRVWEDGYQGDDKVRFIQEIDTQVFAKYGRNDILFDVLNPRSSVEFSGYGYSYVEQAIDLIVAQINTFAYNMGVFTEDRLPRGMLLLNGGADLDDVETLEDYIVSVMTGGPAAKWHIPIIPTGAGPEGQGSQRRLEWVSFQPSNNDMQFAQWKEFLWTSVAALWGVDLEELGIRTQKSTQILGENVAPRLEASRSRLLGTILGFLESHLQRLMDDLDPSFDIEFVGYERDDPAQESSLRESELRTFRSIDEIRADKDLKPFGEKWSQMPLNQTAVQVMQAEQQQAMMGVMQGGAPGAGGGADDMETDGDDDSAGEDAEPSDDEKAYRDMLLGWDDMEKSREPSVIIEV